MRPLTCLIAAGMLAVSALPAQAATAYGEAFDTLYRIDLDARTATSIGSAGRYANTLIGNISGLTTLSDGSQYALAGGLKLFLRIDPATGTSTVISPLSLAGQGSGQFDALDLGMTADCDDTLWIASGTLKQVWKIDRQTGATTLVGPTGGKTISGLVARDDVLYGTGSQGDHTFYRIDKASGAATAIGEFGAAAPSWLNSVSMGFDAEGTLWAVLNYVPPVGGANTPDWSDLATIDPDTGEMTNLGPITGPAQLRGVGMKGFTVGPTQCRRGAAAAIATPVGSPWALGLLGLLLALTGLAGARRALRG